jgi:RNA polymerase sigma-70 factor (ECF subfamily)
MPSSKQETLLKTVLSGAHRDYEKMLNQYAFSKVHSHETGEDLVQDTFMKTWLYLIKTGKIDLMKAFLYHILNDLIIDEYRKQKTTSLDVLLEKGFQPSTGDTSQIFNYLDGKTALILIQRLPVTYQKVMRLRYVQELSLKEISQVTGQSSQTIAVQLHRGLKKLRQLFFAP